MRRRYAMNIDTPGVLREILALTRLTLGNNNATLNLPVRNSCKTFGSFRTAATFSAKIFTKNSQPRHGVLYDRG